MGFFASTSTISLHVGLLVLSWALLGPSWGHLGASWAILGASWAILGPSLAILGHLGANFAQLGPILASSWAVREVRNLQKTYIVFGFGGIFVKWVSSLQHQQSSSMLGHSPPVWEIWLHALRLATLSALPVPMLRQVYEKRRFR